jgi:hypothetical protein
MRLRSIKVLHFRTIADAEVSIGDVTRLIGANGAGKSTVLKAIEMFYAAGTPATTADDYFNRDQTRDIEITLTFDGLDAREQDQFSGHLGSQGELSVTRVFSSNSKINGRYFGSAMRNPAFGKVRATEGAREKTTAYKSLKEDFPELRDAAKAADVEPNLRAWELDHPDACTLSRDDGQFFGFQNVGQGKLGDSTMLVFIPAVRDASIDAADGKGSASARLLDLVVKSAIETRPDIRAFRSEVDARFRDIMDPSKLTELGALAGALSDTLQSFYENTTVLLKWQEAAPLSIPLPAADMRLNDDGFDTPVDRTGHGLQRALIITLLQHLAIASRTHRKDAETDSNGQLPAERLPSLLLAIEEPELYQHPTKQFHVAAVLEKIASGEIPGVSRETQVIFTTHSPLFVSMDRFEEIQVVRRHKPNEGGPRRSAIKRADLGAIAGTIADAWGYKREQFTGETLKPRLHVLDASVAEGFFATVAVLVEGISDRAAIVAAARRRNIDLGAEEIAVLPVGGKHVADKPLAIFRAFDVPTFVIWDCDGERESRCNSALAKMAGLTDQEIAELPSTMVGQDFACFDTNLETVLAGELGSDLWAQLLDDLRAKYGLAQRTDAQKVPRLMLELLTEAFIRGAQTPVLDRIIDNIIALKNARYRRQESSREAAQ